MALRFKDSEFQTCAMQMTLCSLKRVKKTYRNYSLEWRESPKTMAYNLTLKRPKSWQRAKRRQISTSKVNNKKVEQVENYTCLGAIIAEDGESRTEIRTRLAIARKSLVKLNNIWSNRGISSNTKKRLLKTLIWPIATYGCETWTLNKIEENKLNAFEMWTFRRILRISYRAHKTNDLILQAVNERRTFLTAVKRQKLKYFGHIRRSEGLGNIILEGKIEGKRSRGRQRTKWSDNIKKWCNNISMREASNRAAKRREWRQDVINALTSA